MSKQCALAAQRARHGTAPPLGKGRDCPICSMCLLSWDNLWLSDSKVLRYVRRCYPFNNSVEENRAGNLLCCFPSYLARLSTLIAFNLLRPLSALPFHMWALWSFLPLTRFVPFPSPHFKHLHVSVNFSLKLLPSIVCFSQITSSQDKNCCNKTPFDRVRQQQQHLFSFSRLLPVLWSELTLTERRSDLVATACPPRLPGGCEIWQPRQPFSYLAYTCAV